MNRKSCVSIFVFISILIILICFISALGTGDVYLFMKWLDNISEYGIIEGFAKNQDMYPPLAPLILHGIRCCLDSFPYASLYAIKIALAGFLFSSCIIARVIYKDDFLVIVMFLSMFFSVTNRYLDVFVVPFALLAYYFLKSEKYFLGGVMLALACLMKYQPLIVMPIIGAGYFHVDRKNKRICCRVKNLATTIAGALIPVLAVLIVYREGFMQSIAIALFRDEASLAQKGLNLGWVIQFIYEKSKGLLVGGEITILENSEMIYFKYIFVVGYLIILTRLLLLETKSIADILGASLSVYILYYLYNTNVHENHLFVGMLLAFLLYTETKTENSKYVFLWTAVTHNLNMLIFYGVTGGIYHYDRVIMDNIDPTLFLAASNVIIGSIIIIYQFRNMGRTKDPESKQIYQSKTMEESKI